MADEQTEAVHLTSAELRDLLSMVSVSITDSQSGRASEVESSIWAKLTTAEMRLNERQRETPVEYHTEHERDEDNLVCEGVWIGERRLGAIWLRDDGRGWQAASASNSSRFGTREEALNCLLQREGAREIERTSEESGLSPRRWDGTLQQWAKDILKRAEPKQDEAPREEQVQRPRRGLRM